MAHRLEQRRGREAAGLYWLRAPERQPEVGLPPGPKTRLPFGAIVRHLAEAQSRFCESRLRVLCFLTCLFFSSCRWDTLIALVGHPSRRRQEAAFDDVGVNAA